MGEPKEPLRWCAMPTQLAAGAWPLQGCAVRVPLVPASSCVAAPLQDSLGGCAVAALSNGG